MIKKYSRTLLESSLSKIWNTNNEYDCGAITAFRLARNCGKGKPYTRAEKNARNKSLLSKLLSLGYKVISVKGKSLDGNEVTKEESFFVVDRNNSGKLFPDLVKLGEEFDQDSILYVEKGFITKKGGEAFLYGTNRCKGSFPGYHKKSPLTKTRMGRESPIYSTYVNGRPFFMEDIEFDRIHVNTFGIFLLKADAKKPWEHFIEEDVWEQKDI